MAPVCFAETHERNTQAAKQGRMRMSSPPTADRAHRIGPVDHVAHGVGVAVAEVGGRADQAERYRARGA